jgi:hypothetical protein
MDCPHCSKAFHPQFQQASVSFNIFEAVLYHQNCPGCNLPIVDVFARRINNASSVLIPRQTIYPLNKSTRQISSDVPEPYRQAFIEADLVLPISAKASAALSRRIVQALLRDKAGTTAKELFDQIEEVINNKILPSFIADQLHAVRQVGNFAAHEIKDKATGEIIDVEPGEAEWTITVVEALLDFYFVEPAKAAKRKAEFNEKLEAAGKPQLTGGSESGQNQTQQVSQS